MTRTRPLFVLLAFAAALGLTACVTDPSSTPAPNNRGKYTNPDSLIAAHASALSRRDLDAYTKLLDDDFRYYPQTQDLQDMPWVTGDSWGKADELGMIAHMFDPHFQPTDPYAGSVDSIHANIAVLGTQADSSGTTVLAHATLQVLYDASTGASCDVRFQFRLVTRDGFLKIREIHELPLNLRVEPATWGRIKSVYR